MWWQVVAVWTVDDIKKSKKSYTGEALRKW
jgi:hypothetical protein